MEQCDFFGESNGRPVIHYLTVSEAIWSRESKSLTDEEAKSIRSLEPILGNIWAAHFVLFENVHTVEQLKSFKPDHRWDREHIAKLKGKMQIAADKEQDKTPDIDLLLADGGYPHYEELKAHIPDNIQTWVTACCRGHYAYCYVPNELLKESNEAVVRYVFAKHQERERRNAENDK
ncbi:hypothetical protein [Endozoicomonas acroporae]|uniref:hypothetical protein n=1 Tax=Endozoicomonas acroporae TaxID=1701104 RepID=UPI0013D48D70|nr:hypothetical protein [Endozoicomonas acroporae]